MKKISLLLYPFLLTIAQLSAAEKYLNIPEVQQTDVKAISTGINCMDSGNNIRVATLDEINGKEVDLPLDQSFSITIESQLKYFPNQSNQAYTITGTDTTVDSTILNVNVLNYYFSPDSTNSYLTTKVVLFCTPMGLGRTALVIKNDGAQINKVMTINVIPPIN